MRILVVTSTFPRSIDDAQPQFVLGLCNYLQEQGLQVDVLAPHAYGLEEREVFNGVKVYRFRYFFTRLQSLTYNGGILANLKKNPFNYFLVPFFILCQCYSLWQQIKRDKYDVIHVHWIIPQAFVCAILKLFIRDSCPPVLCTSHGGDLYALNYFPFRQVKYWTLKNVDQLAVVSFAMRKHVLDLFDMEQDKVHVMPMGVDLSGRFKPVDGIRRNSQQLVFVGRLVEKKGAEVAVRAISRLHEKYPELELMIIGDGPLLSTLQKQVLDLKLEDYVRFPGGKSQQELPAFYSSASIALVPSVIDSNDDQEGLGLVTIEAMGCGCAVVASSLAAITDVITPETGLLSKPGDADDLAGKISLLLEDAELRQRLATRGRDRVLSQYDWPVAGQHYLDMFREMAKATV